MPTLASIELKHITDLEIEGKTIRSFHLHHQGDFLMNVDVYSNKLSFHWPASIDISNFTRYIDLFYNEGRLLGKLKATEGHFVAFTHTQTDEIIKKELRAVPGALMDSVKSSMAPAIELRYVNFGMFNSGECRFWAELNSIDGPGRKVGIATDLELSELIAYFYLRTITSSATLQEILTPAISTLFLQEQRGTYEMP
jgi:hypothetical protein